MGYVVPLGLLIPSLLPDLLSLWPGVAVALKQAMTPEFRLYQHQVVANCRALAQTLMELGYHVVTGTNRNSSHRPGARLCSLGL